MSKRWKMDSTDWGKVLTGLKVAMAGALVVFLTDVGTSVDFGSNGPIVAVVISVLVNILRKWMQDEKDSPSNDTNDSGS